MQLGAMQGRPKRESVRSNNDGGLGSSGPPTSSSVEDQMRRIASNNHSFAGQKPAQNINAQQASSSPVAQPVRGRPPGVLISHVLYLLRCRPCSLHRVSCID